ncbi:MAG: ABC transporter permease subunit [Alphaproteobacteria bacterium]|jgi:ABC-2 type transport system permease protein|nr:ABC transporter permease subunit [Alphaproteobacteria bacterium]|tara:strand:+ start:2358 stop:3092 length:735 start_codon:yes stop_codon:yes gene_type:complete
MTVLLNIVKRELASYFSTPLAYVFIVIFLTLIGSFTFYLGNFFARGQADLNAFFAFHPWVYILLIPAVTMRLWAEERKTGTIELLMTLPLTTTQAVIGKFFAAWIFIFIALVLTFPIWITVNYLGQPDNGVILAGYVGSLFMSGAYLSIGSCISAITKNQVIAFVIAATVCFIFTMSGVDIVLNFFKVWAPEFLVNTISSMSFLVHFESITKGVIEIRDFLFYLSVIVFWLFLNVVVVEFKKFN